MYKLLVENESATTASFRTEGLRSLGQRELVVLVHDVELKPNVEDFVFFVCNYIRQGNRIDHGETMAYGYWLTKFQERDRDTLETWEYNAQATDFVQGASLTLRYWRDQHVICEKHNAVFQPPRPDRLTLVSKGVLEGLPVQGVRYPSPEHMSGWWITTDQYDGNIKSLKHEHTYHITAARPDLAKYLALSEGFRFDLSVTEDIWLDEKVASSERV